MATPDITPAQIISALVALLGAVVVLFKLDLSDAQRAAATTIIGTLVPLVWVLGDALIRRARAQHAAAARTTPVYAITTGSTPQQPSAASAAVTLTPTPPSPRAAAPRASRTKKAT
jgi:hypothetical protein